MKGVTDGGGGNNRNQHMKSSFYDIKLLSGTSCGPEGPYFQQEKPYIMNIEDMTFFYYNQKVPGQIKAKVAY